MTTVMTLTALICFYAFYLLCYPYSMFMKIRYTTKIGKYCVAFVVKLNRNILFNPLPTCIVGGGQEREAGEGWVSNT